MTGMIRKVVSDRYYILIVLLVAGNVVAGARVVTQHTTRREPSSQLVALSSFARTSRTPLPPLSGSAVLVVAADHWSRELEVLETVKAKFLPDQLKIIYVTGQRVGSPLDAVVNTGDAVIRLKAVQDLGLLELPVFWNRWVLYDASHVKRAAGDLVDPIPFGVLQNVVMGGPLLSAPVIGRVLSGDPAAIARYRDAASRSQSGRHVSVFAAEASSGCPIGEVLGELASMVKPLHTDVSITVPLFWTESDIAHFKETFGVVVPVLRADPATDAVWKGLRNTYGSGAASSFVAVFTSNGVARVETTAAGAIKAISRPEVLR